MRAVELYRSVPRYVAARTLSGRLPGMPAAGVATAPLRLADRPGYPPPSRPGWVRLRPRLSGICGSDLATVTGRSSFYFSPLVSLPFTPGHEVVADLLDDVAASDDGPALAAGTRVVLAPVLGCAARGVAPCPACASGERTRCDRVTLGHVSPGLQTGFCADTGGGWSTEMLAHRSQLFAVPDAMPDVTAVLVEPLACAVRAVRRADVASGERVLVVGAGAVGLLTLVALRALSPGAHVTAVAKHPRQRDRAAALGADVVLAPSDLLAGVRRATQALRVSPERGADYLLGGVDVALECTGGGLDEVLRVVRAEGRVVLTGLPTRAPDLTPLWFREISLVGAYAASPDDFAIALRIAADAPLDGLVGAVYPLERWRDALDHALGAGRLGTTKVALGASSTGTDPTGTAQAGGARLTTTATGRESR